LHLLWTLINAPDALTRCKSPNLKLRAPHDHVAIRIISHIGRGRNFTAYSCKLGDDSDECVSLLPVTEASDGGTEPKKLLKPVSKVLDLCQDVIGVSKLAAKGENILVVTPRLKPISHPAPFRNLRSWLLVDTLQQLHELDIFVIDFGFGNVMASDDRLNFVDFSAWADLTTFHRLHFHCIFASDWLLSLPMENQRAVVDIDWTKDKASFRQELRCSDLESLVKMSYLAIKGEKYEAAVRSASLIAPALQSVLEWWQFQYQTPEFQCRGFWSGFLAAARIADYAAVKEHMQILFS
jgi:hypothetical protein